MPCNIIVYDVPDTCNDLDTHVYNLCLPPIKDCSPQCVDFDIKNCDDLWNCNLCQNEELYFIPWIKNDLIQFQFQFIDTYNADQENPVSGWGTFVKAELCDATTGDILSATYSTFADSWLVGWNGETSYQLLQVNTSTELLDEVDCWNIRVTSYNTLNEAQKVYCSEVFGRARYPETLVTCPDLMEIEGQYTKFDCCGNYYGDPVAFFGNKSFTYNNKRRYYGFILDEGTDVSKERFGDKIRDIEVNSLFLLKLDRFVPPFVKNMLLNQHLAAETILIDEIEYRADSYRITNENRKSRMFYFDVELNAVCELTPGCN